MELLKISGLVFFGGGLGSLVRLALSKIHLQLLPAKFPVGTLLANIFACTLLGIILFMTKDKINDSLWVKYFLMVGFCGGFSTFSTFGFETVQLLKDGFLTLAIANILISLSLGFLILWLFMKS